jgi:cytochrome P450
MPDRLSAAAFANVSAPATLALLAGFYRDPIRCMDRSVRRFGRAMAFSTLSRRADAGRSFALVGPQYNQHVLMGAEKLRPSGIWPLGGPPGSALHEIREDTYIRCDWAEHANLAKAVAPLLHKSKVDQQFAQARTIVTSEVDRWPTGLVDLYAMTRRLAERLSFALLFGEEDQDRMRELGGLFASFHAANWSLSARLFPVNCPGAPYRRLMEQAKTMQSKLIAWVEESRPVPAEGDLRSVFDTSPGLDGCPLSSKRKAAKISDVVIASYGTTATTLAWSLFLLAQHPRVMADLVDELSAAPRVEGADLNSISSLPLLDAVVKEALRIVTPVPFMGFKVLSPLLVEDFEFRPGSLVMLSPHLTHRLPELYDAPDRFRPERWSTLKPTSFEYIPFSGGRRRCPGSWFAINNLKIALAAVLPRFRITVAPGAHIDRIHQAVTAPRSTVPMHLAPQDRAFRANPCSGNILDLFTPETPPAARYGFRRAGLAGARRSAAPSA